MSASRTSPFAGLTATLATDQPAAHPDAELIVLCARHIANHRAHDAYRGPDNTPKDQRLWAAFMETHDAIDASKPQTLAGMAAKGRAAIVEATDRRGIRHPDGAAWDLLDDVLRLVAGGAEVPVGNVASGLDAELITACEEFDALERAYLETFYGPSRIPDDDERDAAQVPLQAAQKPLVDRICRLQATTWAGHSARLRTLMLEDLEIEPLLMSKSKYVNERLLGAALRDMAMPLGIAMDGNARIFAAIGLRDGESGE